MDMCSGPYEAMGEEKMVEEEVVVGKKEFLLLRRYRAMLEERRDTLGRSSWGYFCQLGLYDVQCT